MLISMFALIVASPVQAATLADSPQGVGAGLVTGAITGLTVAHRSPGAQTVSAALGWNLGDTALNLQGDAQWRVEELALEGDAGIMLELSAGGGVFADVYDSYSQVGLYVPVGFTVIPGDRPFDLFVTVAPGMTLVPATRFVSRGTVGMRVYFR
jgi:hypothetical protein